MHMNWTVCILWFASFMLFFHSLLYLYILSFYSFILFFHSILSFYILSCYSFMLFFHSILSFYSFMLFFHSILSCYSFILFFIYKERIEWKNRMKEWTKKGFEPNITPYIWPVSNLKCHLLYQNMIFPV